MAIFFKPGDIQEMLCSVTNITVGGSVFAVTEAGESVFVSPAIASKLSIDYGDLLQVFAIDNHRAEADRAYSARWRAVRVNVKERLLAKTEEDVDIISLIGSKDRLWTAHQLSTATGMNAMKVGGILKNEHNKGAIVAVKVFASGAQERASAVYYGKSIALVEELIDEIELGE